MARPRKTQPQTAQPFDLTADSGKKEEKDSFSDPSDDDISRATLLAIIRSDSSSASEKTSAIKELRILTGGDSGQGAGPSSMSRGEIAAELRRVRALIDAKVLEGQA